MSEVLVSRVIMTLPMSWICGVIGLWGVDGLSEGEQNSCSSKNQVEEGIESWF